MSINYESILSSFNSGAHVEPQYNSPYGTSDALITKTSVTVSTNDDLSPLILQPSGSFGDSFTDAITLSSERKFTCFPKLPDELKLRIWSFATPGQRVITIKEIIDGFGESIHVRQYRIGRVMSGYRTPKRTFPLIAIVKQPVTTAVCHDSRTVFLKQYPPCFEVCLIHPIYFNVNRDTLLFEDIDVFLEFCQLSYSSPKESPRFMAIADFTLRMPNIFNSPTCRMTAARTLASSPLVRNLQGLTILSSYEPPVHRSGPFPFDPELRLALAETHQDTHLIEPFNTTKTGSSHSTGPQIRYFYYRRRDNRKSLLAKVAIWE